MASEGRRPVGRGDEAGAGRDEKALDIGLRVLDQQLTDSEGRYCGRVDDIELDVTSEGDARIACLLVGGGSRPGVAGPGCCAPLRACYEGSATRRR